MCARRFLGCIFFLVLLVVAGAFAIYQFGDRVLVNMATPKGHFAAPTGDAPDYAKAETWLARPGNGPTLADWQPKSANGMTPPLTVTPHDAATFFVHPTTYLANDRWNAAIAAPGEPETRVRLFVQSQASVFAPISDVWAPRYRQAAFGAFLLSGDDATKALDLAYGDVLSAFDAFMAADPGKRIFLAGHSQGSLHLLRLMRDRRSVLKGRLVAAYIAGWPVDSASDLPAMGANACSQPEETGCVLSWQSFADPANPDLILRSWEKTDGFNGRRHDRRTMVCTNPLTGSPASAPASANLGTLVPDGDLGNATLTPGLIGARCERGFLMIEGQPPALGNYVLPGNNYHVYDYALWWGSIRADAERRLKAMPAR